MDDVDDETHPLILPDVPIVMPKGELPVVREGTIGGIPAYEAERPKKGCGCSDEPCLHGIPEHTPGIAGMEDWRQQR